MLITLSKYLDEVDRAEAAEANGAATADQLALLDELLEMEVAVENGTATDEQRAKWTAYLKRQGEVRRAHNMRYITAQVATGNDDPLAVGLRRHYAPARGIRPLRVQIGRSRAPRRGTCRRGPRRGTSAPTRAGPSDPDDPEPPGRHPLAWRQTEGVAT